MARKNRKSLVVPGKPTGFDPVSDNFDPRFSDWALLDPIGSDRHLGTQYCSYSTLESMARVPLLAALIQTRVNQVAEFAQPQSSPYSIGWRIVPTRPGSPLSRRDRVAQGTIRDMVNTAGDTYFLGGFEAFLKAITRDSLIKDQCHPAGTRIETVSGFSPIESVQLGEKVRTAEGRVRKVVQRGSRSYTGPIYTVKARSQELTATPEHPLLVATNKSLRHKRQIETPQLAWMHASDVQPGMYLCYPKPVATPTAPAVASWGEVDVDGAWALGYYVANGNTTPNTAMFTVPSKRPEIAQRLVAIGAALGLYARATPYAAKKAIAVAWNYGTATSGHDTWLKGHCGGNPSSKRIPEGIMLADSSIRAAFLRGYLEGDGCAFATRCQFNTTSFQLFHQLRILFAKEGIYVAAREIKEGSVPGSGWHDQLGGSVAGKAYRDLARRAGMTVVDPGREREPYCQDDKYFYLRVNEVAATQVAGLEVYNIEVEEDHSYIANGYASHNCNFEPLWTAGGQPYGFIPVDPTTIRRAIPTQQQIADGRWDSFETGYVQVIEYDIKAEFGFYDLAWGIRRPRSSIYTNGYGYPEFEELLGTVANLVNAMTFNSVNFTTGLHAHTLITLTSKMQKGRFAEAERLITAGLSGIRNSKRIPIIQLDPLLQEKMEAHILGKTNDEMQYAEWVNFLLKIVCAVFAMDPSELNFIFGNEGIKSQVGGSANDSSQRVASSRERGLRPLLRSISSWMNFWLIQPYWPQFRFEFAGFDSVTEMERLDMDNKSVQFWQSPNAVRRARGEEPFPNPRAEYPLHPSFDAIFQQAQAQAQTQVPGRDITGIGNWLSGNGLPDAQTPAMPDGGIPLPVIDPTDSPLAFSKPA